MYEKGKFDNYSQVWHDQQSLVLELRITALCFFYTLPQFLFILHDRVLNENLCFDPIHHTTLMLYFATSLHKKKIPQKAIHRHRFTTY